MARRLMLIAATACLLGGITTAQPPSPPPAAEPSPPSSPEAPARYQDPHDAYGAGVYDQALQGFVDQQVEMPEDPQLALNIGSTHYQMRNFEEADRAFTNAAVSGVPEIRASALYNLGNSAYRQGRLQEAVELYQAALEARPDDEDAKFNLEFVRDEIRRRHEEAQKRQQENPQQQQQQQQQQNGQQNQEQQPEQGDQPQDSDGDGLPDELEQNAPNPTDPRNPDSDGDTLPDGQEDTNRNGQVDEGETDPNQVDSDQDGQSDAEEARQQGAGAQPTPSEEERGMTPEEAERYLQALEEGRPDQQRRLPPGRRGRPLKDW